MQNTDPNEYREILQEDKQFSDLNLPQVQDLVTLSRGDEFDKSKSVESHLIVRSIEAPKIRDSQGYLTNDEQNS